MPNPKHSWWKIVLVGTVLLLAVTASLVASPTAGLVVTNSSASSPDDLTLEQLVNITVTSVSKQETPLESAPAAIYVITQEDIRRSGMTSIPELLRMVPGLDVARIDANHWVVSSRGFSDQYANKLLVLVDGRTVYSPLFAGVYWNIQDTSLADIDRIEVIRGPGATLWGANAVNGVINIITKKARDTQGGLVSVDYGTEEEPATTIRYGGQLATNLFYRAYVKYFNRDHFADSTGRATADGWDAVHTGFRLDWEPTEINNFTLQGDYYYSHAGETVDTATFTPPYTMRNNYDDQNRGGNVLGRWTHDFSDTSQLTLQMFFDHAEQADAPNVITCDTYDFDLQHRFALGKRQDIVWGIGARSLTEDTTSSFFATLTPQGDTEHVYNAFLQDNISIVENRLHLTLGSKFEYHDSTGFNIQPSARLAWTPTEKQTVWMAISRAVRTPSDLEQDIRNNRSVMQPPAGPPVLVSVFGNPDLKPEELTAYELGYRIKPVEPLSLDFTAFYNVYDRLISTVQGTPSFEFSPGPPHVLVPLTYQNSQSAKTYGGELLAEWHVTDAWKLTASYALLETDFSVATAVNDTSPQNQFQIRSYLNLPHHFEFNGALYYVDQVYALVGDARTRIPPYFRLDLGVTWRPTKSLEFGITGMNLLDNHHPEFSNIKNTVITEVPFGLMGKVTWRF